MRQYHPGMAEVLFFNLMQFGFTQTSLQRKLEKCVVFHLFPKEEETVGGCPRNMIKAKKS